MLPTLRDHDGVGFGAGGQMMLCLADTAVVKYSYLLPGASVFLIG
jgi:hypothetical protein